MRVDAKALLDRLGKNEFAYKEFADRFSELELWPLFEALLKDPRMASLDDMAEAARESEAQASMSHAPEAEPAASSGMREPFGALFNRYESAAKPVASPAAPRGGQDVRAMLRHLSQLSEKGDI